MPPEAGRRRVWIAVAALAGLAVAAILAVTLVREPSPEEWAQQEAGRMVAAGIAVPNGEELAAVVAAVGACAVKDDGSTALADERETWVTFIGPLTAAWASQSELRRIWQFADRRFCSGIPDGKLGER